MGRINCALLWNVLIFLTYLLNRTYICIPVFEICLLQNTKNTEGKDLCPITHSIPIVQQRWQDQMGMGKSLHTQRKTNSWRISLNGATTGELGKVFFFVFKTKAVSIPAYGKAPLSGKPHSLKNILGFRKASPCHPQLSISQTQSHNTITWGRLTTIDFWAPDLETLIL